MVHSHLLHLTLTLLLFTHTVQVTTSLPSNSNPNGIKPPVPPLSSQATPTTASTATATATATAPKLYDPDTGEEVDPDTIETPPPPLPKQKLPDLTRITIHSKYTLMDGNKIPVLGLGLYHIKPGDETYFVVRNALALGYRHFDDAPHEGHTSNDIGAAIFDSGVPREDVYITSKISSNRLGYNGTLKDIKGILLTLGLDHLNLCLMESPKGGKIIETWDALNAARHLGLCSSIGVSNFNVTHLKAILTHGRLLPVVNQIELHPINYQRRKPLLDWCSIRGVLIQAYGSLFGGHEDIMTRYGAINEVAVKYKVTPAQILLRWGFQLGFQLQPKTVHEKRMVENTQIFDFQLTEDEIKYINEIKGVLHEYWNPLNEPVDVGDVSFGQEVVDWKKDEAMLKAKMEGGDEVSGGGAEVPVVPGSVEG